jgi:tetratricopeptide (TPR) repeat protein
MKHPWFAAPVACRLVLLLSALVLTAHPARAGEWLKYEAGDLTVYSDCSPYRAKSLMLQFAAFQHAARTLMVPKGTPFPRTTIVYFNDEVEFLDHTFPNERMDTLLVRLNISYSLGRERLIVTAWDAFFATRIASIFRQESMLLPHWYDNDAPPYLGRAVSEVLKSTHLKGGFIHIDGPSAEQSSRLAEAKWTDFSEMIKAPNGRPVGPDLLHGEIAQARLWQLGDWILFGGNPKGTRVFSLIEAHRNEHGSASAALESGIGLSGTELADRMRTRLADKSIERTLPFDRNAFDAGIRESPAPDHELHIHRFYMLAVGNDLPKAYKELDQAIASGVDTKELKMARAIKARLEDDLPAAAGIYRDAMKAGTVDPYVYYCSARIKLVRDAFEVNALGIYTSRYTYPAHPTKDEAIEAIAELKTAIRLDPHYRLVYGLMVDAIEALPTVTREHPELLTLGLSVHPPGLRIRYARGLAYERAGARAEAEADFDYLLKRHPDSKEAKNVINWRQSRAGIGNQSVEPEKIEELIVQKRFVEARELLVQALAAETDANLKRNYPREIARLDEMIAWASIMTLTKEKRWAELEKATAGYIESFPHSSRITVVRNRLREARERLPSPD